MLELESSYMTEAIPASAPPEAWDTFRPCVETRKCLAEIQVVHGTGHARGMQGMIETQLKTLSAPAWVVPVKSKKIVAIANDLHAAPLQSIKVGLYTDAYSVIGFQEHSTIGYLRVCMFAPANVAVEVT